MGAASSGYPVVRLASGSELSLCPCFLACSVSRLSAMVGLSRMI